MIARLDKFHESAECAWCAKTSECVELSFEDGFLQQAVMCWKCAQQSVRVFTQQGQQKKPAKTGGD